ncbi:hypothetical protein Vretimale_5491 [Volvox reticuliferus]|uniref:Peptidase S54 rhomboid domain-containing protein n=1 Tax=Volvox reticuliferus TaxID=1737510 RepID=A0A8J4G5G2_9CHLO|nr:hypothetical protein Vretimale_5491 [Volvox reticuliferus]
MQRTISCSYQCTRGAGLTSRNLIATGTPFASGPGVKRHGTPLTCNAVSKKGPLPGGDSTGKSMATLAKSLLRDAMAGRYCKASASSSVIRSPYASVNILKRYVRVRVHALPSTIKAALHVQINNRGRRCGAALPIPGPLPCRWLGLPSAISSLAATGSTGMGSSGSRTAAVAALPEDLRSATYAITATNTAIFFLSALVPLLPASALLLNHRQPQLLQLLTSSFAHPSLESLMLCVFFTYIFGRVVERSHGSLATWVVYATCGTALTNTTSGLHHCLHLWRPPTKTNTTISWGRLGSTTSFISSLVPSHIKLHRLSKKFNLSGFHVLSPKEV